MSREPQINRVSAEYVYVIVCINVGVKALATIHLRSFMNKKEKKNTEK